MNRFRLGAGGLAMLAVCALATAVPVAAQKGDEHNPIPALQAAPPLHVTAFADTMQTELQAPSSFKSVMQYVDSMPAPAFYTTLLALAGSFMLMSHAADRRSRRWRNGGDEEDDSARTHQRIGDTSRWRHERNGMSAVSASPGGGY